MIAQFPNIWLPTLKSAVFGSNSVVPPLVGGSGGLVCLSIGKADFLSDYFDSQEYMKSVDLSLTCHPSPSLTTSVFRSSTVRRLFY